MPARAAQFKNVVPLCKNTKIGNFSLQSKPSFPSQRNAAKSARTWPHHLQANATEQQTEIFGKGANQMNAEEKIAWIDEEHKIISFHAIDDGKMITKAETLFWDYISGLTKAGYRIM